jgi:uncharacterized membrane protein YadS
MGRAVSGAFHPIQLEPKFRAVVPGLSVAVIVGIAATFLSLHYKSSAMLFALLLGMALNFLGEEG